jgi:hypothetical protein
MITVKVFYKNIPITNIYCDEYKDGGSLGTLRLSKDKELICSFPLMNIESFRLCNKQYDEYELILKERD